jgi:hypothetical protein
MIKRMVTEPVNPIQISKGSFTRVDFSVSTQLNMGVVRTIYRLVIEFLLKGGSDRLTAMKVPGRKRAVKTARTFMFDPSLAVFFKISSWINPSLAVFSKISSWVDPSLAV